ncbi:NAD-dependent epimerase/dehydratase family protein [Bacillus mangrovi]|uniref:NAD-dependent epimerase/dehydratase family protein n=1 Tax=Metabacillus mangrovi TaxID=1491830 RepID=A0A7X2S6R3_9BACI|nr:SDR family oxidoreductase [Metabacillus mangrovi]MTH54310.1 NAD-dependent epimerase/dehydratase family protein [Metabacillus mangrovi]
MKKCFITGFPGFISRELIKEAVRQNAFDAYYVLVLPHFYEAAQKELAGIAGEKAKVITGDITKEHLGIEAASMEVLKQEVTHVYHLAAIYDLGVDEKSAELVNVTGTANMLKWAGQAGLECFTYFSTAFVSGKKEGRVFEKDLEPAEGFKNHYEAAKFEAEVLVRNCMPELPAVIIRPGIVTGHSVTGETSKFDGPYYMLNLFSRLKYLPVIPMIGSGEVPFNTVPVNFLTAAVLYLSMKKDAAGITFHVTDPEPGSIGELYRLFMKELLHKEPFGRLPPAAAKKALASRKVCEMLGIRKEALDYFQYHTVYDCSNLLEHLKGSGIVCPNVRDYAGHLVRFYQKANMLKEENIHAESNQPGNRKAN